MSVFLAPTFGVGYQAFNLNGAILSGGQLWTYQAGSSTMQPTYTSNLGTITNGNPIILDATGRPPSEIWLTQGQAYKFVLQDSLGNPIATYDSVSGINDITSSNTTTEWIATNLTPTYLSTTSFSVAGNQTNLLNVNRRIQATVTAGVVYGYISASVYTSVTTVTVVMDGTLLDNGLSIVNVGLLSGQNQSVPENVSQAVNATTATNLIGGSVSATTGLFSGALSGTSGAFSGIVSSGNAKFYVEATSNQSVSSGISTFVTFGTTVFDTASAFGFGNTYTAPTTGYYSFSWGVQLQANAGTLTTCISILSVSSGSGNYGSGYSGTAINYYNSTGSAIVHLSAGDTCKIQVNIIGTSPLVNGTNTGATYFTGHLIP